MTKGANVCRKADGVVSTQTIYNKKAVLYRKDDRAMCAI